MHIAIDYKRVRAGAVAIVLATAFLCPLTVVAPTPDDWWNADWLYRKSVTIDHTKVTGTSTEFPMLIDILDADLAGKAQDDGDDIVFTNIDGNKLAHEIEIFNKTTGKLTVWVKIPSLTSSTNTTIYMYYGNSATYFQESKEQTWDSNFMMVQHFNEKYESHECRFWGMIANPMPETVVLDHLINLPNSLKNLGATNDDGWGLAYYNTTEPSITRGAPPANTDPNFDLAAVQLASSNGQIGIGHIRRAASPPYNVPDPHPFKRFKGENWWVFAHHGTIDKSLLVGLIGDDYLAANPPEYGSNIDEWNDSELYFIYTLKCIEEASWNVTAGVAEAVTSICEESASFNMNFILSNGNTLWAFRKGDSTHLLYYCYSSGTPPYSAVASEYPTSTQGNWIFLENYNFIELTETNPPLIYQDIRGFTSIDHFDSTVNNNDGAAQSGVTMSTEGKIDGADMFDGTDDYVRIADNSTLDGGGTWNELTIEFWVKSSRDNQKATTILSKRDSSSIGSYQIGFDSSGNSQLFLGLYLDSGYGETTYLDSPVLATDVWYHVVGTLKASTISLYVNGVLEATATKSGNIKATSGTPLRIGCRGTISGTERYLAGSLDEIRLSRIGRDSNYISTSYHNQQDPSTFFSIGEEETILPTTMKIAATSSQVLLNATCTVSVEMVNVKDLYAWEFQLNYNQTVLDLTANLIVAGGLNEPTIVFYDLVNETAGHVWFAVTTANPTTTGISYSQHAIFEMQFTAITTGTANIELYGTVLSDSNSMPITHEVQNGSLEVVESYVDLTVTDMTVLDNGCSIYADDTYANGASYYYPIEVTIYNSGTMEAGASSVNLTVHWLNGSVSEMFEVSISSLDPGSSVTVNFTNAFHPIHTGIYELTAVADNLDSVIETDETNNEFKLENVIVTVIGDANRDKIVNILDAVIVSVAWNSSPADHWWDARADINHDVEVNLLDGVRASLHWGAIGE